MNRKNVEKSDTTKKIAKALEGNANISSSSSASSSHVSVPSSPKSSNKSPLLPRAYNHRDVLGLKKLTEWRKEESTLHTEHNRILQPGFMQRNAKDVLNDAESVKVEWLTDYCCPSVSTSLFLHIGKEMVVNYKVKEAKLNDVAQQVHAALLTAMPNAVKMLEDKVQSTLNDMLKPDGPLQSELLTLAIVLLSNHAINDYSDAQLEAAKRLIIDRERKKITDQIVSVVVRDYLNQHHQDLGLQLKSTHDIGKTHDYCFLGAAGSGKSTIAKQYLSDEQKNDYTILATDNYRAFILPNSFDHEKKSTKDVFTRTQDMAYLIKELVLDEINWKLKHEHCRSNIICDCINLEGAMHKLLAQGKLTSVVAAYRGEPGFVGIVERADHRAHDPDASPADKGRFIQTTDLLQGHVDASVQLLAKLPKNVTTIVYDTHVEKDAPPVKIAEIDSKLNVVVITDLRVTSEFFNKRQLNTAAINQVDLIFNSNDPLLLLATHPENKAKSVLDMVPRAKIQLEGGDKPIYIEKPEYIVKLKNKEGIIYAELTPVNDKVILNILDKRIFFAKSNADTIEGTVLRAMTRQVTLGGLSESFNAAYRDGDKQSFNSIMSQRNEQKQDNKSMPVKKM